MTDALVAFLRARLDDDEKVARAADPELSHVFTRIATFDPEMAADERHIMRQDPARTLRDVEAARAVLDLYEEAGDRMDRAMKDSDTVAYQEARIEQRTLRKVLLSEAAVHEAHPDYLEEWRP
ncbi:DUF6221 family protein [Streptomyces bacillaris]|uniref:DUF6221 family protein n=1 Tax=Streptomyces bacillaris TaxID=68179 RepID=UPI003EBF5086